MTVRLSRRERDCLKALAAQETWPLRSTTGWLGEAAESNWVPRTRQLLRYLASLGLAVDESSTHIFPTKDGGAQMAPAERYRISDTGRTRAQRNETTPPKERRSR